MVGVVIRNMQRENDKPIGLSFRRKDQISSEVIWSAGGEILRCGNAARAKSSMRATVMFSMRDAAK